VRRLGQVLTFWGATVLFALAPAVVRAEHEPGHEGGEHAAEHGGEHAAEHGGEHAAGAHEASLDMGKLTFQLINFAVLAGILGWFGGRAVNKALLERHNQLKADLVTASEARLAAEKRAAEQEKRLASLETEIEGIRAGIKEEAEAEKQRLIAAAEERAKRIGDETKFLLDQQVKEAEATLKREVAEAAVKIAEALVTKSLTGSDQQRLVDTFVTDAAKTPATGRSA
jgi:F-type H+-transporting ATPase subunit b